MEADKNVRRVRDIRVRMIVDRVVLDLKNYSRERVDI